LTPASHLDVERLLTPEERARLAELEETVLVGASAALLAGRALTEIRDARLYRGEYPTFEVYVQERFAFSRARAYQLIDYAAAAGEFEARGIQLPPERITRALGGVLPDDYQIVLDVTRAVTGKATPSSADVQGVAGVVQDMAAGLRIEHPQTGEPVPYTSLPAEQRGPALAAAVQRGSQDRRDFQGTDDGKPMDYVAGLQQMGTAGALRFDRSGYWLEVTDGATGELMTGPTTKSIWDAPRGWRAKYEAEEAGGPTHD
jgi:hypothetical protein